MYDLDGLHRDLILLANMVRQINELYDRFISHMSWIWELCCTVV